MNNSEFENWLLSLKVGDEVTYHHRFHGYIITTIEKITPTRQIKTADGNVFKNGRCRVDAWVSYHIYPVTDKIRQDVEKKKLIYYLDTKLNLHELTNTQLKAIKSILEGDEHGGKSNSNRTDPGTTEQQETEADEG